jgi:hypothetical protein
MQLDVSAGTSAHRSRPNVKTSRDLGRPPCGAWKSRLTCGKPTPFPAQVDGFSGTVAVRGLGPVSCPVGFLGGTRRLSSMPYQAIGIM